MIGGGRRERLRRGFLPEPATGWNPPREGVDAYRDRIREADGHRRLAKRQTFREHLRYKWIIKVHLVLKLT
jgi:hypothetical protein